MIQLLYVWFFLFAVFSGVPFLYYLYMKRVASKAWELNVDYNYRPRVSILIPTYNERRTIRLKLENLVNLHYPRDLTQIIIVDSASTDNTMDEVQRFVKCHPEINLDIVRENDRSGKSHALNLGLERSTGEIIIVSDADCFWPPDILNKALPYLADPRVGAVAGEESLLNPNQSWVTKTERIYRNKMFPIRLGESKIHSTIRFEGGFGAYKKSVLDKFDCETGSDDSGTALNIVQNKARTIIVPEVTFFTFFPNNWKGKITIKTRRASHLLQIWIKCLKLSFNKRLVLPKRIALPEIFLHLLNPPIFFILTIVTLFFIFHYTILLPFFMLPFLITKSRVYLIEVIQDNFIMLLALATLAMKRKAVVWRKAEESRTLVDIGVLRKQNLIKDIPFTN